MGILQQMDKQTDRQTEIDGPDDNTPSTFRPRVKMHGYPLRHPGILNQDQQSL